MKDILSTYFKMSDAEYELFVSKSKLMQFKKHEHLLNAESFVDEIFFIKRGLVRGYRLIDGNDVTHHFFQENWFATDYESFLTGKPKELYLQALFDTTVYTFKKDSMLSFYKAFPKFEKIRIILAEHAFLQMVQRLKDLQTLDLKERYNSIIHRNPDLLKLVPQKHIASYLGVAPQSLSRIKNNTLKQQ